MPTTRGSHRIAAAGRREIRRAVSGGAYLSPKFHLLRPLRPRDPGKQLPIPGSQESGSQILTSFPPRCPTLPPFSGQALSLAAPTRRNAGAAHLPCLGASGSALCSFTHSSAMQRQTGISGDREGVQGLYQEGQRRGVLVTLEVPDGGSPPGCSRLAEDTEIKGEYRLNILLSPPSAQDGR